MLRSIVEYAKLSASDMITKIVGGAIVVVPFIFAGSYGLSAIYMALRNSYGDVTAAVIMSVAFAAIGVIAAIVVIAWIKNNERRLEETRAEAKQSAFATALLAANPALIWGAARVGMGLFRRAPVLTAVAPLAAGFVLAMASARERRLERQAVSPTGPIRTTRARSRPGNARDLTH